MTVGIVGSLLILSNLAVMLMYKQKIAYIAESGAKYVTRTTEWLGARKPGYNDERINQEVKETVNSMLEQMGLPAASDVQIENTTVGSTRMVKVTLKIIGLKLLKGGQFPQVFATEETGIARSEAPPAVVGITFDGSSKGGIFLPAYGAGNHTPGPQTYPSTPMHIAYYGGNIAKGSLSGPYSGVMGNKGPYTPFPQ